MKFTLVKDLKNDPLMRPLLSGLLLFTMLFIISDIGQKKHDIGLHVSSASATFYGNEAAFIDPISLEVVLQTVHTDLFFMMMILLTLGAVYGRLVPNTRKSRFMMHLLNASALGSLGVFIACYYTPLVVLWVVLMWSWHIAALVMSLEAIYRLWR